MSRLLLRQLFGQAEGLRQDVLLFLSQLVNGGLVLLLVGLDLFHQSDGLLALLVQFLLLADQIGLGRLRFRLAGLQREFFLRDLHLQRLQVVNDLLVGVHDLVDIVETGQHVRETGSTEEDGPVADLAPLLHGPDPVAEQLVLCRLPLLRVRQLRFCLDDQLLISADLCLHIPDLSAGVVDLLVQLLLPGQHRRLVIGQAVQLLLQVLLLGL